LKIKIYYQFITPGVGYEGWVRDLACFELGGEGEMTIQYFLKGFDYMSSVILDNLGLGEAYRILRDFPNNSSETLTETESVCWQQLLTAAVLWDDSFYLPNRGSISIGRNDYRTLGVNKLQGDWSFEGCYSVYAIKGEDSISPFEFESPYYKTFEAYVLASSLYRADVLLHPSRSSDFEAYNYRKVFSVLNLLTLLDDHAKKYIDEINAALKMNTYIDIPLLYGYIKRNTTTIKDEFIAAKELHNHRDVVSFRNEMDELKGTVDITKIHRAAEHVKNIIDEIMNKYKGASKKSIKTKLSAGISPKFNPENGFIQNLVQSFYAKAEKEWSYEKKEEPEFNFIFLETISDYGLRGEEVPIVL